MGGSALGSVLKGRWYFVVTVCSAGLLAWVPFVHAGNQLRRRSVTRLAWCYAAVAVIIGTLVSLAPKDSHGEIVAGAGDVFSTVGGLLAIATIALGCVQQAPLRREVYGGARPQGRAAVDPAVSAALEARERRANARQIATQDPLLARDLKIGRPDLSRTYDDGGLVDLNSASPQLIAEVCDLSLATGEEIAAARPPGGYLAVDDVFSFVEIPVAAWDVVRDRAVAIPRPV
jgi:hypothetical protein